MVRFVGRIECFFDSGVWLCEYHYSRYERGGKMFPATRGFAEVILERTLLYQMTNVLNNSKFMLSSGLDKQW